MSRRTFPMASDPRLRTLEGKLKVITELRGGPAERAVPLLLELLCDHSWHVRERAVEALVERGREVVEPIKTLLEEGLWYTRSCAAEALGRLGDREALDALAARFADPNAAVRKAVTAALLKMASRHGGQAVREALERAGASGFGVAQSGKLGPDERELARALEEAEREGRAGS